MDDVRALIAKDIEERELIKAGIKRIRTRQILQSVIGAIIIVMFTVIYVKLVKQIRKQDNINIQLVDMLHQNKLLIDAQYQLIDTLTKSDTVK